MNAYIFEADIFCEDCGEAIRDNLTKEGQAPEDPEDEGSYDSDDFPKGPYPDGGGEADCPQHCGNHDRCLNVFILPNGRKVGAFLENPLTLDGVRMVEECCKRDMNNRDRCAGAVALEIWAPFYEISIPSDEGICPSCGCDLIDGRCCH